MSRGAAKTLTSSGPDFAVVRYAFCDAGHPGQGDYHLGRRRHVEERAVGSLVVQQPAHGVRPVPYGFALLQRLDGRVAQRGGGGNSRAKLLEIGRPAMAA